MVALLSKSRKVNHEKVQVHRIIPCIYVGLHRFRMV